MTKKVEKKSEGRSYGAPIVCVIVVVLALMAVMVAVVATRNTGNEANDVVDTATDGGGGVADYSVLRGIGSQELLDFLSEKKTGFIYLGRPTCPSCQKFAPILTKVVKADGVEVFYYDTDAAKSDPDLKTEALDAVGVTGVPTFMYVADGVEVGRLADTGSEAALREFIGDMTEI